MAITDILSSDAVSVFRSKINEMLDVVNVSASYIDGTLGSRPAANSVPEGTFHRATDTGDVSVSDGTTWFTTTPGNRCSVYAEPAADQSVADGATDKVLWGTEVVDVGANFASSTFTAPVKGDYRVTVALGISNLGAAEGVTAYLYKNGAFAKYLWSEGANGLAGRHLETTLRVRLDAGDTVDVYTRAQAGQGGHYIDTANVFTHHLEITLVAQVP